MHSSTCTTAGAGNSLVPILPSRCVPTSIARGSKTRVRRHGRAETPRHGAGGAAGAGGARMRLSCGSEDAKAARATPRKPRLRALAVAKPGPRMRRTRPGRGKRAPEVPGPPSMSERRKMRAPGHVRRGEGRDGRGSGRRRRAPGRTRASTFALFRRKASTDAVRSNGRTKARVERRPTAGVGGRGRIPGTPGPTRVLAVRRRCT
eukprot:scaffold2859_cov349-Pavlova_lutheri.AAC.59